MTKRKTIPKKELKKLLEKWQYTHSSFLAYAEESFFAKQGKWVSEDEYNWLERKEHHMARCGLQWETAIKELKELMEKY